ncbi:MAG: HigA family addiction module antitoxin [Methylocella sp.]
MATEESVRLKEPVHPGGFVKSEIIEALGLSVTEGAQVLGVTRPALSALLNERAHLSPEMALRIEKTFGVSMDTLMRMQNTYSWLRVSSSSDLETSIERVNTRKRNATKVL